MMTMAGLGVLVGSAALLSLWAGVFLGYGFGLKACDGRAEAIEAQESLIKAQKESLDYWQGRAKELQREIDEESASRRAPAPRGHWN